MRMLATSRSVLEAVWLKLRRWLVVLSILTIARSIDIATDDAAKDVDVGAITGIVAARYGASDIVAAKDGVDEDIFVAGRVVGSNIDHCLATDVAHQATTEYTMCRTRYEVDSGASLVVSLVVAWGIDVAIKRHVFESDIANQASSIDVSDERTSLDGDIGAAFNIAHKSSSEDIEEAIMRLGILCDGFLRVFKNL